MPSPFTGFLNRHFEEINRHLVSFFTDKTDNADIEAYLYAPLGRFSANAGKRHRPLICMLACQAVGGDFHAAISAAEMTNTARQPILSPMNPLMTREARMPVSSPLST